MCVNSLCTIVLWNAYPWSSGSFSLCITLPSSKLISSVSTMRFINAINSSCPPRLLTSLMKALFKVSWKYSWKHFHAVFGSALYRGSFYYLNNKTHVSHWAQILLHRDYKNIPQNCNIQVEIIVLCVFHLTCILKPGNSITIF